MFLRCLLLGLLFARIRAYFSEERSPEESKVQPPTVVVAILARNSAHSLPYYLGALERLNYPKDRISVWWVFLRAQSGGALRTMLMLAVHAFFFRLCQVLCCNNFCLWRPRKYRKKQHRGVFDFNLSAVEEPEG